MRARIVPPGDQNSSNPRVVPIEPTQDHPVSEQVHRVIDRGYRELVEQCPQPELLQHLCAGLAQALALPLVALVRRDEGGTLELEAASSESLMWAELIRLPERWDGSIAGNGPASRALHERQPVRMSIDDEGFLPWREAARHDGLAQVGALPLPTDDRSWVLILGGATVAPGNGDGRDEAERIAISGCARLLDAQAPLARQRLLATALTQAGNAAFIADMSGGIVWCNAALSRHTGFAQAEIIGRHPRFLDAGRQGLRHYRELRDKLLGGQTWRGETVDRDRSGAAFTATQTLTPLGLPSRITHVLAIYDDTPLADASPPHVHAWAGGPEPLDEQRQRSSLEHHLNDLLAQGRPLHIGVFAARRTEAAPMLGSMASDGLVAEMRARIRAVAGEECAAGLGPGEFLVQLPEDRSKACMLIAALRRELSQPYPLIGELPGIDIRVGTALAPRDGATLSALLRSAEQALGAQPLTPVRARRPPTTRRQGFAHATATEPRRRPLPGVLQ